MKAIILILSAILVSVLILPANAATGVYSTAVLADNPALYYQLDESSGTTAVNSASTGATDDGTYTVVSTGSYTLGQPGALATSTNPGNTAVTFTGTPGGSGTSPGAYINSPFSFNPSTTAFTVEFWINPASLATTGILFGLDQTIVSQKDSAGTGHDIVYFDSNTGKLATAVVGVHDWASNPASFVVGQWTMVDLVYDGAGNLQWYANGSALGASFTGTPTTDTGTIVIAAHKTLGAFLNGTLDEFAFYETALTDTQVLNHYDAALPEPSSLAILGVGTALLLRRKSSRV